MIKFDIYKCSFIYQEDIGKNNPRVKDRPVLVLSVDDFVIVAKITGTNHNTDKCYFIQNWKQAGLSKPSYIQFDRQEIKKYVSFNDAPYIGHLSDIDIQNIKSKKLCEEFFINMKFKLVEENELKKRNKWAKKRQKGMSPFTRMDAGNVEKGIEVFNNSTGDSIGDGCGMGESFTDNDVKMESSDLLTELNSLEAYEGISKVPYELIKQYESVLDEFPVGTVLKLKIDAGEETYTKKDSSFWNHHRAPWGDDREIYVFDLARWFAGRKYISRSSIEYGQKS